MNIAGLGMILLDGQKVGHSDNPFAHRWSLLP